jgi:membrane-associated phospholipid phosphatase
MVVINAPAFWQLITRLGEAPILLPAALLAALALLTQAQTRPTAGRWLLALLLAATLTTVTKLAFIGWGVGIRTLNFTGISGHAMFAASIYPCLLAVMASNLPPWAQRWAVGAGLALAVAVGLSRIEVGAHSLSEVVSGLVLGGLVTSAALLSNGLPRRAIGWVLPAVLVLWLVLTPVHAPPMQTHSYVIRLSLALAGIEVPYTRAELLGAQQNP